MNRQAKATTTERGKQDSRQPAKQKEHKKRAHTQKTQNIKQAKRNVAKIKKQQ